MDGRGKRPWQIHVRKIVQFKPLKITFLCQNVPLSVVSYILTVVKFRLDSRLPTEPRQSHFFWNTLKTNFYKIVLAINSYFTKIKAKIDQNRISDILSFLMKKPRKDKMGTWGYNQIQKFYPFRYFTLTRHDWSIVKLVQSLDFGSRYKSSIQRSRKRSWTSSKNFSWENTKLLILNFWRKLEFKIKRKCIQTAKLFIDRSWLIRSENMHLNNCDVIIMIDRIHVRRRCSYCKDQLFWKEIDVTPKWITRCYCEPNRCITLVKYLHHQKAQDLTHAPSFSICHQNLKTDQSINELENGSSSYRRKSIYFE